MTSYCKVLDLFSLTLPPTSDAGRYMPIARQCSDGPSLQRRNAWSLPPRVAVWLTWQQLYMAQIHQRDIGLRQKICGKTLFERIDPGPVPQRVIMVGASPAHTRPQVAKMGTILQHLLCYKAEETLFLFP
ncbi:hypothetical protein PR048_004749 [Dryococelus australis]|uniref:Uncharacterized protein n=1 Tax=Dryococelus australis TaxID=614101 RepID=A0ABQ9I6A7_9NEOP|nr:hypothetical protein PR048_004749 [Dryococelus australis]